VYSFAACLVTVSDTSYRLLACVQLMPGLCVLSTVNGKLTETDTVMFSQCVWLTSRVTDIGDGCSCESQVNNGYEQNGRLEYHSGENIFSEIFHHCVIEIFGC